MSEHFKTYAALVLEQGGVWAKESPLHMTLCQPAMMDSQQVRGFISLLKVDLHEFGEVMIIGGEEAKFGPHYDISVRKIGRTAEILALHEIVLAATQEVVPGFTLDYPEYQPHVTDKVGFGLRKHERRMIHQVTILSRPVDGVWAPAAVIPLQDD